VSCKAGFQPAPPSLVVLPVPPLALLAAVAVRGAQLALLAGVVRVALRTSPKFAKPLDVAAQVEVKANIETRLWYFRFQR